MNWYRLSGKEVLAKLNTDEESGLTKKEALRRLRQDGENKLTEKKQQSRLALFAGQFKDLIVLILIVATAVSAILGEYIDALAIMFIVILNGILGYIQERKAEKSLEALQKLSTPLVKVKRNHEWVSVPATDVVVGDIVKMTSGDRIGADMRLIRTNRLRIEESALTGESVPVDKRTERIHEDEIEIGERTNMAFTGTLVTEGNGVGVIVATGMRTEMGKIAHLLQTTAAVATPLQQRLEQLGRILIAVALVLTALVVVIGVMQGHDVYTMVLAGVSLAVAAIPEGLPAIVTVVLALGVQRMIRHRAIVRKLQAIETLGCVTVICSDKTGTLTQNKMTVTHLWTDSGYIEVSGSGYQPNGEFFQNGRRYKLAYGSNIEKLLQFSALCSNAEIHQKEKGEYILDGDPTEGAIVACAMKGNYTKAKLQSIYERVYEIPFDSTRKMMSVIVKKKDRTAYLITKGAPDLVAQRCHKIYTNGKEQHMTPENRKQMEQAVAQMSSRGLRTLAVAYKRVSMSGNVAENELVFLGLYGMADLPRPDVEQAIIECHEAGIKTVMITGDHVQTATAIAKKLRMLPEGGKVLDGKILSRLSVEQLREVVDEVYVFARVSPEHKLKIVQALQQRGHIVAMTGDGVNDAPAMKAANVGIAMGITGTDVAKEASSLILSDDHFATIKEAIKEGRNIYENIRKFIRYMLASNVGEILVMLFAMILAMPLPLAPIQILWINLVTDGLPAMALGMDAPEGDVMKRRPRNPQEGIFTRRLTWKILSRGLLIGLVTLVAFSLTLQASGGELVLAQTVAFMTLVMAQLIHVFDCRSEYSIYHRPLFENRFLLGAVFLSFILMVLVVYYPPLQPIFHTTSLGMTEWLLIIGMAAIPTISFSGYQFFKK